jgi:hypothetical protein
MKGLNKGPVSAKIDLTMKPLPETGRVYLQRTL